MSSGSLPTCPEPDAVAPPPARSPVWLPRLACAGVLTLIVLLSLHFVRFANVNADEGFYLAASQLSGEGWRAYRDFGFTQSPLLSYVNLPWLEACGYDLAGIRLASLGWTLITLLVGIAWLARSAGWTAATVFAGLLLLSPHWLAYGVMGKTYAFAGLTILIAAWSIMGRAPLHVRWAIFLLAAAAGVAARLPTAAFFLPVGFALLTETTRWPNRILWSTATLALAGLTLWLASAGAWEAAWYWTVDFHRESTMVRSFGLRLREFVLLAPVIWIGLVWRYGRPGGLIPRGAIGLGSAMACAVILNLCRPSCYGEYLTPFVPVAAWVAAPALTVFSSRRSFGLACTLVAILGVTLALVFRPALRPTSVIENAALAAAFLRQHVPREQKVIASMPEIPIASGHGVPLELAMGKFALSEGIDPARAATLHVLTPAALLERINDSRTGALALSRAAPWNFAWSVPRYQWLSESAAMSLRAAMESNYEWAYDNDDYVILLRKPVALGDVESGAPMTPSLSSMDPSAQPATMAP
jgi:hypothetical protein